MQWESPYIYRSGVNLMGLTEYNKAMIKALCKCDIREARGWAELSLDEDKTQKNSEFVKKYKEILTAKKSGAVEIPRELNGIITCENVQETFKENRYYLTAAQKAIADKIFRMSRVCEQLMEMQIPYKNATLLYGPPGTGKTTFGKYIAYKLGLPFCYLNFSKVVDSYMGATSKNISQAFMFASTTPCVFMLDEVDAISINRAKGNSGSDGELGRVTVTLMQEFDKLENDIVLIAATNRADMLDPAFISRCATKGEMLAFSKDDSIRMVKKFLKDINMDIPDNTITKIVEKNSDQRSVMFDVVSHIAEMIDKGQIE